MLVNPITPLSISNRKTGASAVSVIPQVHSQSIPTFTGSKRTGILTSILMALGLSGCPENNIAPNVDTVPPQPTSTATATVTATSTATSTATTPDTAVTKLNAAWENAGISIPDPDQPPKSISYVDSFSGDTTTMTLDTTKTGGNNVVYKSLTGVEDSGVVTFSYDPTTNTLTKKSVGDMTGATQNYKMTMDADGYTVFTNTVTGKFDAKWRKINTGQVGVYDQTGKLCRTFDNFTVDGYLAKLQKEAKAPIVRFADGVLPKVKKVAQEMTQPTKLQKYGRRIYG